MLWFLSTAKMESPKVIREMGLHLVMGQKKIPIHLDLNQIETPAKELTVGHLTQEVFKVTGLDASSQRLISRGRTIFKAGDSEDESFTKSLASFGIQHGDKVMVLGRKPTEKKEETAESNMDSSFTAQLREIEIRVEKLCEKCEELFRLADRSQSGTSSSLPRTVKDLEHEKKSFLVLVEDAMRLLEFIDSSPSSPNEDYRKQRKSFVNKIQSKMDVCESHIEALTKQIKSADSDVDSLPR